MTLIEELKVALCQTRDHRARRPERRPRIESGPQSFAETGRGSRLTPDHNLNLDQASASMEYAGSLRRGDYRYERRYQQSGRKQRSVLRPHLQDGHRLSQRLRRQSRPPA